MADGKITNLAEFCAEAQRVGLTAADLAEALKDRPEFADCLPTAQGWPLNHNADPVPLPKLPAAIVIHPQVGELFDRLQMHTYAMGYAIACAKTAAGVKTCPECHGTGQWQSACQEMRNCEKCDGRGTIGVRPSDAPSLLTIEEVQQALPDPTNTHREFKGGTTLQMTWHHLNQWAERIQRAVLAKHGIGVNHLPGSGAGDWSACSRCQLPEACRLAGAPCVYRMTQQHPNGVPGAGKTVDGGM